MASYLLALAWGLCVLLSFVGWGTLVGWLLFRKTDLDWALRAAWGISLAVLLGGVVNLFGGISQATVFAQIGVGLLCWIVNTASRRGAVAVTLKAGIDALRGDPSEAAGLVVFSLLLAFRYASGICEIRLGCDDLPGYLVFPARMLQEGWLGLDPFCARRMMAALGGHSYLLTHALCASKETGLYTIEPLMGTIVSLGLVLGYGREADVPRRAAVWIAILLLLIEPRHSSLSSITMGLALFMCLVRTLSWLDRYPTGTVASAAIIALVSSALCALKATHIPACAALVALSYVALFTGPRPKRDAIVELVLTCLLGAMFLLPWMLDMYRSSGTPLFPVLGRGCHVSAYGDYLPPWRAVGARNLARTVVFDVILRTDVVALLLLSVSWLTCCSQEPKGRAPLLACVGAAIFGSAVTAVAIGGCRARDGFPTVYCGIFLLMARLNRPRQPRGTSPVAAVLLAAGMLLGCHWRTIVADVRFARAQLGQAATFCSKDLFASERERMAAVQEVIPPGAHVLAVVPKPFLLDFKRHTVYVGDYLGLVSPPPGIPAREGPDAVRKYLLALGIDYVVFSYVDNAGQDAMKRRPSETWSPWLSSIAPRLLACLDVLQELTRTSRRLFDDGSIAVLDLTVPAQGETERPQPAG